MRRGNFNILANYAYYTPGAIELLILLVWFIVGVLLGNVVSVAFTTVLGYEAALEYSTIVSYPLMFLPMMLYASAQSRKNSFIKERNEMDRNNFAPVGAFACCLVAILATLASGVVAEAPTMLLPQMPDWLKEMFESMTGGKFWINFITVCVFAPFFEEWLCRGTIMRGLMANGHRPVWAIVISAAIFALIHANPWQAVAAFLLGLLFGYVYYRTGSLKMTMLMHFTNNFFALVCGHIDALKDMESWKDVLGTYYWPFYALCAIIVVLCIMTFKKIPAKAE